MVADMNQVVRAAAALLIDGEKRALLVQQGYGQRRWGLPGSGIRSDDLPVRAVVREVRVETALEIEVVDLIGLYHLSGNDHEGDEGLPDLLTYVFGCRVAGGEPVLNEMGRIARLGWYDLSDVPHPATTTAKAAMKDAAAGRSGVVADLSR
jgi:8-oxo-dGTP diphosphatase